MKKKINRSGRKAILTENQRATLRKAEKDLDPKTRSDLLHSLLPKIEACIEDLNLIWNAVGTKKGFEAWVSRNFNDLYNLGQAVQIKNRLNLKPSFRGRVKITYKDNSHLRNTRYYWIKTDDGPKQYSDSFSKIEGRYTGIARGKVRDDIIKADKKGIIPTNEKDALSIEQIRKLIKK